MVSSMKYEVLEKLYKNPKFLNYLRQNSYWYKQFNRNADTYDKFIHDMKIKYRLRTIDKVDNFVDSVDLITKIMNVNGE